MEKIKNYGVLHREPDAILPVAVSQIAFSENTGARRVKNWKLKGIKPIHSTT